MLAENRFLRSLVLWHSLVGGDTFEQATRRVSEERSRITVRPRLRVGLLWMTPSQE